VLWRRYVQWGIVGRYVVGATLAFLALRTIAFLPDKALVYLFVGTLPFIVYALPKRWLALDITDPGMPYLSGALIMLIQMFGGASGHILDLFFQASPLDRKSIVATKGFTQVVAHLFRIAYFGSFASAFAVAIPSWVYVAAVGLAIIGTTLAGRVLERMTDTGFRVWSKRVVLLVSAVYVLRGLWLAVGSIGAA
jgi:hypothetical protein